VYLTIVRLIIIIIIIFSCMYNCFLSCSQQYLEPLKSGDLDDRLIEPSVVDEIFHQVKNIVFMEGIFFY
jgi:hypothetical protein